MKASIGEMVKERDIIFLNGMIEEFGVDYFFKSVQQGAWKGVKYAYLKPCNAMRHTEGFKTIQMAFILADFIEEEY